MMRLSYKKVPALGFTLEMSSMTTLDRILSRESQLSLNRIIKYFQELSPTEKKRYEDAKTRLSNNRYFYLSDKTGVSLQYIRDQIRLFQEQNGFEYIVVFVDLFGKISDLRDENMAQSYERNLNIIQAMARDLNVHFVLVAQISRMTETRKNVWGKRPSLHNIKNSGAWEEVADLVLLLFRAKYYDDSFEDDILEIHIAKQRDGVAEEHIYFQFFGDRSLILDTDMLPYDKRGSNARRQEDSTVRENITQKVSSVSSNRRRELVESSGSGSTS